MTDQAAAGRDGSARLSRLAFGYATSQILYAAVQLDVPGALAGGDRSLEELAGATGSEPPALRRLLRALIVLGVLCEIRPERFALTASGRSLLADHPGSLRSSILFFGHPAAWRAWGGLANSARTGQAAFDHANGESLFAYLARHPDLAAIFNLAMGEGTSGVASELPRVFNFDGAGTVVDVGGGNGTLLAAVLAAAPDVEGVLFDTADGVAGAAETCQREGLDGRCQIEIGDFFEAIPPGDVMLLKGVLHDWDDARCTTLLRNCRRSISARGRLLVLEPVLPAGITPEAAGVVMSDIAMLVYTGGQERSEAEYRRLLSGAGFDLVEVTGPLAGSETRLLVARPA